VQHPLVNQREIRPGDRLVIEPRFSVMGREAAEIRGEAMQRVDEQRLRAQILPHHTHVIGVMKLRRGKGAVFESCDEVAHDFLVCS